MDKLLERCAKHREEAQAKKHRKSTRRPKRNTNKLKQDTLATVQAPRTHTQTTNQSKKVAKNATSGHASTTKHAKDWQQAQTQKKRTFKTSAPGVIQDVTNFSIYQEKTDTRKHRKFKPDGTPLDPDNNPVMKHSIVNPDGVDSIDTPKRTANSEPGTTPTPGALTTAPNTEKIESKTGEDENGLTQAGALTLARENASTANKLSQAQRSHVYQLLAAGYRNSTILAHIRHNLGVRVSRQSISEMRRRQPDRVEQGRKEIQKEIALAAPIADKIHRIAKRQELINSLERKLWRTTSVTKAGTRLLTGTHETINRILDSVKAELEPYEVNVSVDLRGKTAQQYKEVSDSGVISEAMDKLKAAGMEVAQVVAPIELDK